MRVRVVLWSVLLLLLGLAVAWWGWPRAGRVPAGVPAAGGSRAAAGGVGVGGVGLLTDPRWVSEAEARTNRLAWRLSNTARPLADLMNDGRAILLANALLDSSRPAGFTFPAQLQPKGGDPGAYIVQARGPVDGAFRAALRAAGATEDTFKNYIPNHAYLARLPAAGAERLRGNPLVQAVVPYEPYYKIQMPLLGAAVRGDSLGEGALLNLGLFAEGSEQTLAAIESQPGVRVVGREQSPFGPVVRVQLARTADWTALAGLAGVQIVEPYHRRVTANDLSRVTVGVATNTTAPTNYLNLTGQNVLVAVNDSGIDATHPDFTTGGSAGGGAGGAPIRVMGDAAQSLVDTSGHGTHVAGIIAGNGAKSYTTMAGGAQMAEGSVSNADFRGAAPLARLYSIGGVGGGADPNAVSDRYFQEQAALTNALIDNNSWSYGGANTYDLAAAGYDAATRDALPEVTGSQPVLFVFAAGNDGYLGQNGAGGDNNGGSVTANTITSPGTAKDVITVTALEQMRNITNVVTDVKSNQSAVWAPETDTGYQVAGYASRGNVGVGMEGPTGRLKPDVAAPGTFEVSTRSGQWDTNAYYHPTNRDDHLYTSQSVDAGGVQYYSLFVPANAVSATVRVVANNNSPQPFPNLPVYVSQYNFPDPANPATYDFVTVNNQVNIPGDGGANYLTTIQGTGFNFAVANTNNQAISYNLFTEVTTTNDLGNYYAVLEGMNDGLGGYYRYESGTSMAAAKVSGTLALIQDFFTNQLQRLPSPALLKAMLINGARPTLPTYNLDAGNPVNNEGWGLINLPNTLPTNSPASYNGSGASTIYLQDQSPTNALATGQSHAYGLTLTTNTSNLPLRLTLTWTDPPGDPVAAIKLVNSLQLVVTNLDDPANPVVYYGNNLAASGYNPAQNPTNNNVRLDAINNVQKIILPQPLGSNYVVAVLGRAVNVNAVSAQTNIYALNVTPTPAYAPDVAQDYALVISAGDAFTVTDRGIQANPTGDQNVTIISATNAPLSGQMVGANAPVLSTNAVSFVANQAFGGNAQDTLGMTNQWHFYVVTNNALDTAGNAADVTNAAFIIFSPETLAVSRMSVFANALTNAVQPQANLDLFVTTDPGLTNLNPATVYNCINGPQAGATAGNVFNGAALSRGGAKFVVDTNSHPGEVYYVGVKSEDQLAAEYSFLAAFTATPFSLMRNGNELLTGFPLPSAIPGGTPSQPGFVDVVAIALNPIAAGSVIVTNVIQQTSVGDLVSSLTFNNASVVLMSHNSPNTAGTFGLVYDDSGFVNAASLPAGYTLAPSAGPGSLQQFVGQNVSSGVWVFHVANSVAPFTGSVQGMNLLITPRRSLTTGTTNTLAAQQWLYYPVDVPPGATNLTISATNLNGTLNSSPILPLDVFVKLGAHPTTNNFDKMMVIPTTPPPPPPGSSLTIGPTDVPPLQPGRYWVGVFNPNPTGSDQTFSLFAAILPPNPGGAATAFTAAGSTPLLDDAVMYSGINVATNLPIVSLNVGIEVRHPRISDLVFYLISPAGTRALLMENRGGASTNGAGSVALITNTAAFPNFLGEPNRLSFAGTTAVISNGVLRLAPAAVGQEGAAYLTQKQPCAGGFDTTFHFRISGPFGNACGGELGGELGGDGINFAVQNASPTNLAFSGIGGGTGTNSVNIFFNTFRNRPGCNDPVNCDISDNSVGIGLHSTYVAQTDLNPLGINLSDGNVHSAHINFNGAVINVWVDNVQVLSNVPMPGLAPGVDGSGSGWVGFDGLSGCAYENHDILDWTFSAPGLQTNYLTFTENTNLTLTPIKFLPPPFTNGMAKVLTPIPITNTATTWFNGFEGRGPVNNGVYPGQYFAGGWYVEGSGYIDWLATGDFGSTAFEGSNYIDLNGGSPSGISTNVATVPGLTYMLNFAYVKNPDLGASSAQAGIVIGTNSPIILTANQANSWGNLGWQTKSYAFIATSPITHLAFMSTNTPGASDVLLDAVSLTIAATNYAFTTNLVITNRYTLPEQSLSAFTGQSAQGLWQLEIQDDRAGAGLTNALVGWQLQFVFANTNAVPLVLSGGIGQTNQFIPAGSIAWYQINVPLTANFAANRLLFASAPVNVWFDTNSPPTTNRLFFSGTSGANLLSTTNAPLIQPPPHIYRGQTYYLGVQNPNAFTVNYGIEVDFDFGNAPGSGLPAVKVAVSSSSTTLVWKASTTAQFQVQWTDDLTQPWQTDTNVITSGDGNFTFTDDGSQTAPLGASRYYRLILIVP